MTFNVNNLTCLSRFQDREAQCTCLENCFHIQKPKQKLLFYFFFWHINLDSSVLLGHKFSETFLKLFPLESEQQLSILTRSLKKSKIFERIESKEKLQWKGKIEWKRFTEWKTEQHRKHLAKTISQENQFFRHNFYFLKDHMFFTH